MAQLYFSLVTTLGRIKLAASAAGGPAVNITHFAIGDGNGVEVNPSAASTGLVREVWRTAVDSVEPDPLNPAAVLVTAIIPTAVGGWWMREFGIFDGAGDMVAVAKPVSQYKPTAAEGQLEDIRYEFQIIIGETANVTLLVDPSILMASREWVETRKTPINRLLQTPWLPAKSVTVVNPPGAPAAGDIYVIPAGATGAWAGQAGKLAEWTGLKWAIIDPPDGQGIGLPDGKQYIRIGGVYVLRGKVACAVTSAGIAFAEANHDQLAEAMARYASAGVFYTGSGPANAYVLTPLGNFVPPAAYFNGMEVSFYPPEPNTGATTINVAGLGAKPLLGEGGNPLPAGRIDAGLVTARYSSATGDFWLLPWSRGMSPPYILGGGLSPGQSMPHGTTTRFKYDLVANTMGAVYNDGLFTVPRDGTYLIIYRASFENKIYTGEIIATQNGLDATLAPSSPYGAVATLWTYVGYFNGTYTVTNPSFAGVCVIDVKEGEVLALTGRYIDNSGAGSRNLQSGKLAIILLN